VRIAIVFGLAGAFAIYAAATWLRADEPKVEAAPAAAPPSAASAQPSPPAALPAAAPEAPVADEAVAADTPAKAAAARRAAARAQAAGVDMVIAPEQVAQAPLPVLELRVTSEPSGATVRMDEQRIGVTPLSFDWRHARARVGGDLVIDLELPGHRAKTVRRKIEAPKMNVYAVLEPFEAPPPPPSAAPPAPPEPSAVVAEEEGSAEGGDEEVLEIRPIELGGDGTAQDDTEEEEDVEDGEEPVLPNPFRAE
jgi:hypothetical protein